jgi:hypothetical protein
MEYLAECFWPGVGDADLSELDERATTAAERSRGGQRVRYLGSLLMRKDEVVLCRFEGSEAAVRAVAAQAAIPFERILEASVSRWRDEPETTGADADGESPTASAPLRASS